MIMSPTRTAALALWAAAAAACGGDVLIRAEVFRAAGGFDPRLIAGEELGVTQATLQTDAAGKLSPDQSRFLDESGKIGSKLRRDRKAR